MKPTMLILFLFICGIYTEAEAQRPAEQPDRIRLSAGYKVGDTATDFNLKNVDGQFYSLAEIKDAKGYIVIFTSNVCPFALLYEDRIIELHKDMAPQGYPVIAINSNDPEMQEGDSFENMKIRADEKDFPFLYLEDEGQKIYPQYGATKTPHVFLLDGDLTVQYIGAIDDNAQSPQEVSSKFVRNAIAALEKGELPNPNSTKAIGCPIKAKGSATSNGGPPHKGERRGPPSPEAIIAEMDANNDKKVSKTEAKGPLARDFDRLDEDEDGFLTLEELAALQNRRH